MTNYNTSQENLVRRLSKALIVSGTLNIALLVLFFYWTIKETPPTPYFELKPAEKQEQQPPLAVEQSSGEVIRSFRTIPLEQLIAKLTNTQLVENGYTQRDIALAALSTFHYFDLSRALLGQAQPVQERKIPFGKNRAGENVELIVYPGLSEEQFQAITHFANTERWPLTSHGLFLQLRKQGGNYDTSLSEAFFLTQEFLAVEMLFNRSEAQVEKKLLLDVLCQGSWNMLTKFVEQQRTIQDLSAARRQSFLIDYIKRESRAAAHLLLKTDGAFAARKLDDENVLLLLNLLVEKTPDSEQFAMTLLTSPRSDQVWQLAAFRLYDYAGEPKPDKNLHHAALTRFVPLVPPVIVPAVNKLKPKETIVLRQVSSSKVPYRSQQYIIQEGDSLWKISRRFHVEIETLKKFNHLETDFLKPGTILKIPPS